MKTAQHAGISASVSIAFAASVGCGSVDSSAGMVNDNYVVINEVVPKNQSYADEDGNSTDWIELHNLSNRSLSLKGYFISDDSDEPLKIELTAEAVIARQGYLILWADPEGVGTKPLHLSFGLSGDGERLVLSNREGKVVDSVKFGAMQGDQAYARFPNGTGDFAACDSTTPGESNGHSCQ